MPRWSTTKDENRVQRTRPFRCASGVLCSPLRFAPGVLRNVHRT
jgi:hypothetical protein